MKRIFKISTAVFLMFGAIYLTGCKGKKETAKVDTKMPEEEVEVKVLCSGPEYLTDKTVLEPIVLVKVLIK